MNEIGTILEQARLFAAQHAPPELVTKGIPLATIMLLAGISTCVLGAKLARWALTTAFVAAGAIVGAQCARIVDLHPLVCAGIAAAMVGTIGFLTFRLWAGVMAAVVVSSLALGIFGYQRVIPHIGEFEGHSLVSLPESVGTFSLPSPEQQEAYLDRTPQQWVEEFWAFATAKDARLQPNAQAIGLVATLAGLLFGLVATRAALILATSFIGTGIVAAAVGMLTAHFSPGFYEALLGRPQIAGAAIGGFLVTSLVLQTILTRKSSAQAPSTAKS